MKISRLFHNAGYKGSKGYLDTQKKYEIGRTVLYFAISISLFVAGYIQTKERVNVLSLVAALGCLPASKSLVVAIMFCRFKSLGKELSDKIETKANGLTQLFDLAFTSEKKTFLVNHAVIHHGLIVGYSNQQNFSDKEFQAHLTNILTLDGHKDITIKVFTDLDKYEHRLEQLKEVPCTDSNIESIAHTLKSVTL